MVPSEALVGLPGQQGFSLTDDGGRYRIGDLSWTFWGYAERVFNPGDGSSDIWRRFRQGSEIDFPRVTASLRPAFVYEFDLADTNFFANGVGNRRGVGRRDLENVFVALQDANDSSALRALIGENTAIMSREDNLSSGNLPTVNRSLILEEHNGAGIFGPQTGIESGFVLTPALSIGLAVLDGRGSFNQERPRYDVGNSFSGKLASTLIDDTAHGRRLTFGIGVDDTKNFHDQTFTLLSAILQRRIGAVIVNGDKLSGEADAAYTFPALFRQPATIEAEAIVSHFDGSHTTISGGYAMVQHQLLASDRYGGLDLFGRYDIVSITTAASGGRAAQQAVRLGANYNLPYSARRANLHVEYAHNLANGPVAIVQARGSDEFIVELRFSLQPYIRH